MPGINQILQFAGGGGANVLTPTQYAALANIVANGFQSGVLPSNQLNVVLRQSAFVSAMIAQFIADKSGQNVNDDGNLATLKANFIAALSAAGPGRLLNVQVISASGTYTPTAGMVTCIAEVQGGGGGGGGGAATGANTYASGGGGASGSYAKATFTAAQIGASQAITIGAAGAGAAAGANTGGAGGTTSLGSLVSCPGGAGGIGASASSAIGLVPGGNPGGMPSGSNIYATRGIPGSPGITSGTSWGVPGAGGGSPIAGGGGGGYPPAQSLAGIGGFVSGAGGSGANSGAVGADAARAGGNGAAGMILVWEFA